MLYRIAEATSADIPGISFIVNSAFAVEVFLVGPRTDEDQVHAMMEKGKFIVAKDPSEKVVASVFTELRGDRGYFGMLAINPPQQGQGLGRLMVQAAEDHFRTHGCRHVDIDVLSVRPELFPFYRKLGYTEVGTTDFRPTRPLKDGAACQQVLMSKQL